MAYRKSKGKMARRPKKLEPAPLNLSFTAPGTGTNYIDLSQAASIVNRRFYRQGLNWAVAGFTVTVTGTTSSPGSVTVCKVPTTWPAIQSWKESFRVWNKMQDEVLDDEPDVAARYRDFKVYLNAGMLASTQQTSISTPVTGQRLLPTDCEYNLPFVGVGATNNYEWAYSHVQIPDAGGSAPPIEATLQFLGDSTATAKGMIHGYALSRARPQDIDPNVPAEIGWMQEVFDTAETLQEIREDVALENNRPPYSVSDPNTFDEFYPGGEQNLNGPEVVGYAVISNSGGSNAITAQRRIDGSAFPCGLVQITSSLPGINMYDIIVHLVPGTHKGYLCEPMQDM